MREQNQRKTIQQKRIDILIRLALILAAVLIIFFFAIKPMLKKDYYFEAGEDYNFSNLGTETGKDNFDVLVVGDGVDAVTSAVGAAKVGAETLLVCTGEKIGSNLINTLDVNWSADFTPTGNSVSSDIFKEIRYKAGEGSNLENYVKELSNLALEQKNLTVLYNAKISEVVLNNGKINSVTVKTSEESRNIKAKRYIDATLKGDLLQLSKAEATQGYEDIGLQGLFIPAKLNFEVSGVDIVKIQKMMQNSSLVNFLLKNYKTGSRDINISGMNVVDQGNGSVIIEAVSVSNVNITEDKAVKSAYIRAEKECEELFSYLKANLEEFQNASQIKVAKEFLISAPYHYRGRYQMTLSDVLTGKRYTDRISTASRPVTFTMGDGNRYVLANPKTFYIPLGSMIPEDMDNMLMTGDKISASSLIQTSISSNSSRAGTGYAAGIISAYSISKDMEIPRLIEDRNLDTQQEIEKILRKMGIYMSDIKEDISSITGDWSYPYAEKLINLGLLSGGITNDYKYGKNAKTKDLAFIILNGVPRVAEETYNYNFDITIRKYLTDENLTKEKLGLIVLELFQKTPPKDNYYSEACKLGLIDDTLQEKLKNSENLKLSEVYYASVSFIEEFTGKKIK